MGGVPDSQFSPIKKIIIITMLLSDVTQNMDYSTRRKNPLLGKIRCITIWFFQESGRYPINPVAATIITTRSSCLVAYILNFAGSSPTRHPKLHARVDQERKERKSELLCSDSNITRRLPARQYTEDACALYRAAWYTSPHTPHHRISAPDLI